MLLMESTCSLLFFQLGFSFTVLLPAFSRYDCRTLQAALKGLATSGAPFKVPPSLHLSNVVQS